jgi:hypothetical protein
MRLLSAAPPRSWHCRGFDFLWDYRRRIPRLWPPNKILQLRFDQSLFKLIRQKLVGFADRGPKVNALAANVLPVIREIQAAGVTSVNAIAGRLNQRGVYRRTML